VTAPTMDEAAKVLADPLAYADEPKLHVALTHLRVHAPVSWVDVPSYRPFWAITKHADIMAIERDNTLFTNSPRPVLMTDEADELQAAVGINTLIHMDDPQHRVVRAIGRLVPPEGDAGVEASRRRTRKAVCRQHDGVR
jgi:cytochrome P450